ncbi:MAG: o-succinylbenzoate synthase [Gammaproteobacteria bacterium]|nr:o-succinylbenzoate synthase [Gammaproteobacteria bacterium]
MIIDQIKIIRVSMPLINPFRTAFGINTAIESVLVQLCSNDYYGWGEASSWRDPAYSPECSSIQFTFSRDFIAPLILHNNIRSGNELQKRLCNIKGNYFAKAAFDMAWWDLYARKHEKPLWKIIDGKHQTVDVGADFGIQDNLDQLLEKINTAVTAGYKRIKLKSCPGWDLVMIDAVRKEFPDITIHIDCNSFFTLNDLDMFKKMDHYNLAMIEQPLAHDDLIDHAKLQSCINTPICLDESITSVDKARKAIQINACRWINIKPGRVGGTTNAIAIHNLCQQADIPCWIGGMLESAIGASHCLALATLANIRYPSDIFPSSRFYFKDLATPPMKHSAPSQFRANMLSGIGVEPDPLALKEYTLESAVQGGPVFIKSL